jgi:hypothetical protein
MWPDNARSKLLRAVCRAFNNDILPTRRNIHVISEPEACALYVIQDVIRNKLGTLRIVSCTMLRSLLLILKGRLLHALRCWRWYSGKSQYNLPVTAEVLPSFSRGDLKFSRQKKQYYSTLGPSPDLGALFYRISSLTT